MRHDRWVMSHFPSDPQDKVLYRASSALSAEACKLRQWMTSWGRNYTSAMGENMGAAFQSCWLTHRPHPASCFLTPGVICQCMCGKFPISGCISTKPLRNWDWKKQPNNLRGSRHWVILYTLPHQCSVQAPTHLYKGCLTFPPKSPTTAPK